MATASRYDAATPAASPAAQNGTNTTANQSGNSSTTGNSNTTSSSNTSGSSRTTQDSKQQTNSQNMSGSSLAALEVLIQQMLGGGTQEMAQGRALREQEIARNQGQAAAYTKDAAFNDAQGLIAQTMRQTLEKLLPSITRGSEGAGTSQGSMRALLTQKAAQDAAEAASAQGLNAAVQYGQVNAGFGSILERLTQPDNSVTNALLQALQTAKGAVTSSTTTGQTVGTTVSDQSTNSSSNTNSNQNTNTNQSSTTATKPNSGGGISSGNSGNDLVYYGAPQTAPAGTAGSSIDFIQQLNDLSGNGSGWSSGFTF